MITFSKYHGTGNDFILINNRNLHFKKEKAIIAKLCHRRFGIGADGLILLENAQDDAIDFDMAYYNADGAKSTMCGNGGRCIVKFAQTLNLIDKETVFSAIDGLHQAKLLDNSVALKMGNVNGIKKLSDGFKIDTGSPHYIKFVKAIENVDVEKEGRNIRYSSAYNPKGINVNFVEIGQNYHKIRTYERGVEAETYSCGTGAVAAAIALMAAEKQQSPLHFQTHGGNLEVQIKQESKYNFSDIWLTGPVTNIFEGTVHTL